MSSKTAVLTFVVSCLLTTSAIAASPPNPGGGGQAIAGTAAAAREAGATPGASSWGGARAAVAQGDPAFGGLTQHDVNAAAKQNFGGDPTPGKP